MSTAEKGGENMCFFDKGLFGAHHLSCEEDHTFLRKGRTSKELKI
jgi:hypothetical protein